MGPATGHGRSRGISSRSGRFPAHPYPPNPSLAQLERLAARLVEAGKEQQRTYRQQLRRYWFPFLASYGLDDRASARIICLFIAWTGRRIQHVDEVLSAVRWHCGLPSTEWNRIRRDPRVLDSLHGLRSVFASPVHCAPPLLPTHLRHFVSLALRANSSFGDLLAAALVVAGFGGVMRLEELTVSAELSDRDLRKAIRRDSVLLDDHASSFVVPTYEMDRSWHGLQVTIVAENSTDDFNFILLLRLYLKERDKLFPSSPYLFVRASGLPPSPPFLTKRLAALGAGLTGLSLRAGGTAILASRGVRRDRIQRRSASDTVTDFPRDNPAVATAVQRSEPRPVSRVKHE